MEQPYLRFKTDDGSEYPAWEEKTLGEFFTEIKEKNHPDLPCLSNRLSPYQLYSRYGNVQILSAFAWVRTRSFDAARLSPLARNPGPVPIAHAHFNHPNPYGVVHDYVEPRFFLSPTGKTIYT